MRGRVSTERRAPRAVGLAVAAALAAGLGLAGPAVGAKKGGGVLDNTTVVNAPIPDRPSGGTTIFGRLDSTTTVGRRFKGRVVRDVNVTVQTTGTSGNEPASQVIANLTAPNGAITRLFGGLLPPLAPPTFSSFVAFPSLGPLTLDDESRFNIGVFAPRSPVELYAPYAGGARPTGKPLAVMDGGPVRGTWTLTVLDAVNGQTSNLASWRLNVIAGRPFVTK